MKKRLLALALAAFVVGGAFAESTYNTAPRFNLGGGFSFSGGRIGRTYFNSNNWVGNNALGFGGHVFFGTRLIEMSLGLLNGPLNSVNMIGGDRESERMGSMLSLEFNALLKIPIDLGGVIVFPLLGTGRNFVISASDEDGNDFGDAGDSSTFRLKFGVGTDFDINENLFFRMQGLGWYGLAPDLHRNVAALFRDASARGGFGGSARLAVGFRF